MSLPNQNSNDEEARRREAEADAMRQKVLLVLLEPTARQRLANVRIVKPE
jgi:DNA-binding TFAR19-related protein (PDSD5 family)